MLPDALLRTLLRVSPIQVDGLRPLTKAYLTGNSKSQPKELPHAPNPWIYGSVETAAVIALMVGGYQVSGRNARTGLRLTGQIVSCYFSAGWQLNLATRAITSHTRGGVTVTGQVERHPCPPTGPGRRRPAAPPTPGGPASAASSPARPVRPVPAGAQRWRLRSVTSSSYSPLSCTSSVSTPARICSRRRSRQSASRCSSIGPP